MSLFHINPAVFCNQPKLIYSQNIDLDHAGLDALEVRLSWVRSGEGARCAYPLRRNAWEAERAGRVAEPRGRQGQSWSRVRCVVALGPGDTANTASERRVGQQQPIGSVNPVKEQPVFDQAPSTDEASFLTSLNAVAVVVVGGAEHVRAWRDLR
jgi:hypothetical protein